MRLLALALAGAASACTPPPVDGSPPYPTWRIAVLPDTQEYAHHDPDVFYSQTDWLAAKAEELNLRYVLHVGDVVDGNSAEQWRAGQYAMGTLNGVVPYAIVPGNHDYVGGVERRSRLTDYFPVAEMQRMDGFLEPFEVDRVDSSAHRFEVNGEAWLILALEWGPRDSVLAWANRLIDAYPDHRVIVLTHAYLYMDDTRYDWATKGEAQKWSPHGYTGDRWPEMRDGEEIWRALIAERSNVHLVLCGHVAEEGTGRLTSVTDTGAQVHQLLANFQGQAILGPGYLRILTFHEDRISVTTYSPWLDRTLAHPDHEFDLPRDGW